jgi:hypothetical protein
MTGCKQRIRSTKDSDYIAHRHDDATKLNDYVVAQRVGPSQQVSRLLKKKLFSARCIARSSIGGRVFEGVSSQLLHIIHGIEALPANAKRESKEIHTVMKVYFTIDWTVGTI